MISLFFRNSEIRYRIFICLFLFLISGCAQLDGIFPKLKPQSDEKTSVMVPFIIESNQPVKDIRCEVTALI